MKPDPTFEHIERRRLIRRRIFLTLASLLIACGYAALAIPPETPSEKAIPLGFLGIGCLLAGLFLALLGRSVP